MKRALERDTDIYQKIKSLIQNAFYTIAFIIKRVFGNSCIYLYWEAATVTIDFVSVCCTSVAKPVNVKHNPTEHFVSDRPFTQALHNTRAFAFSFCSPLL